MIFLEDLIIDRLKLNMPRNVYVLGTYPMNNQDTAKLSLQPTPAVHVFEKSLQIFNDDFLVNQDESTIKIKKQKQVWIIIVVKNTYDLKNSPKYGFEELEKLKCRVISILTYWNPQQSPFITPLSWEPTAVESLYEATIGFVYCPMIIETSRPYYETMERIKNE